MLRIPLATVTCVTALAFAAAPAVADPTEGVPTDGCHGQTVSGFVAGVGVKEVAASFGLTVQEAQANVKTLFCAGQGGVPNADACHGQTVSTFAEGVGVKEVAASFGLTVQEAQANVDTLFCAGA